MAQELTDNTTVIEAPSFIVPYIYEKNPLMADKKVSNVSGKNQSEDLSKFAESTLFKLTASLGEDLVQEFVHKDMTYKKPLKKNNEDLHLKLKVCQECSFETESTLILEHHMEEIHRILHHEMHQDSLILKKNSSKIMKHIQEETAKLEMKSRKDSFLFTAPQFLFDDKLKGKLTRRELEFARKRKLEKFEQNE